MNWLKPLIVLVGSISAAATLGWLVGYSPLITGTIAAVVFIFLVGADLLFSGGSPENPHLGYASVLRGPPIDGVKVLLGGLGCSIPLVLVALAIAYILSKSGR